MVGSRTTSLLPLLLLLIFFIELGVSLASATTILRCRERERKALVELKRLLRDPSDLLSSWAGEDCCAWEGVGCSNTTGHVTQLDLRFSRFDDCSSYDSNSGCKQALSGDISPSLLSLHHLTLLDLNGNHFGNPIPAFLGSLTRLTYLDLSVAGFIGPIPDQLGNLSSLNYLDLSYNIGLYLENPGWISRLTSLRLLNMTEVSFTGSSNWLQALNALPLIREIELGYCHLGAFPLSLPHSNFTSLTFLSLRSNDIYSTVPDWLLNITTFEYLDLGLNYIYWYAPAYIANWTSLKALDLSTNVFIHDDFLQIALSNLCMLQSLQLRGVAINDMLSQLEVVFSGCLMFSLEKLDLGYTHLNGPLPRSFWNMKNLKYIDLYFSSLNGSLPHWIGNMKNLIHLDLSDNSLSGPLPASLRNLSSLQYLSLRYNNFSGTIAQGIQLDGSFSDWLGNMKNLEVLDLSHNSFHGQFPLSIGNLSSLQSLSLGSNNLNGVIGESIGKLKDLSLLDLGKNSLSLSMTYLTNLSSLYFLDISYNTMLVSSESDGWIPAFQLNTLDMTFCQILPNPYFPQWLRTQTSLTWLELDNTGIRGILPNWLPVSLESLYLSNNYITGDMVQYFPNLKDLSLKNNSFSGQIHQRMADMMPNLEHLDLSYNRLSGEVPSYFLKLRDLSLSNNLFSGQLPTRISSMMQNMIALDLSMNNLSGSIPWSFCENENWFSIQLSDNNFSGEIPNCWKNSSNAFIIDFSNNQLQGRIPDTICNMWSLRSLHLSHNNLFGAIPYSLRNCTSLVTLDLGHNNITGNIPTWLENRLQHLKTLSLRSNAFTGPIPELSHLGFLQILDLSNNYLFGHIPHSFGNFTALRSPLKSTEDYFWEDEQGEMPAHDVEAVQLFLKGYEVEYKNLLSLVTLIDLSNNDLLGNIPEELEYLHGLLSLNLSGNHLVGEIPENISKMEGLEILDLSRNSLSGAIPSSLTTLNFLSHLNLSYNNLSGRIPIGSQFQTFNASIYDGNPYLCGPPLTKNCTDQDATKSNMASDEDGSGRIETIWLYAWAAAGFIMGFWIIFGTLLLKRRWRILYFRAIDDAYDRLYVIVAVNIKRIKSEIFKRDDEDA